MSMKLRANHLTVLRIVLLPLPYFLVYQDKWARVGALIVATILGLTDYLDGLLARRDGSTPFGQLLDPIADKIFVAVVLVPLVDLQILPLWLVWPIFLREYLVTELRRFLSTARIELPVTELAKIKTTIQMSGTGFILLADTFPERAVPVAFFAGAILATTFLAVGIYWKEKVLPPRIRIALGMLGLGMLLRLVFDVRLTILAYGGIILGVTLASGAQYLRVGLPVCLRQGATGILRLVSAIALPLLALAVFPWAQGYTGLIVLILCVEFSMQGLDIWSLQKGMRDLSWLKRKILFPAALVVLAAGLLTLPLVAAVTSFLLLVGAGCLIYAGADIWIHRSVFS